MLSSAGADEVRDVVFDATYMVLGLGDVYLGAPCAVPMDPRHRLVVPKYNPARTFTPEGEDGLRYPPKCFKSNELLEYFGLCAPIDSRHLLVVPKYNLLACVVHPGG